MIGDMTTLRDLVDRVSGHDNAALMFEVDGVAIRAGYHITEVKQISIDALDCGKGRRQWRETVVQILDGPDGPQSELMTVGKFATISKMAADSLSCAADPLRFELAPSNAALQTLSVADVTLSTKTVTISLEAQRAACKPLEDWLTQRDEAQVHADTGCCRKSKSRCCP